MLGWYIWTPIHRLRGFVCKFLGNHKLACWHTHPSLTLTLKSYRDPKEKNQSISNHPVFRGSVKFGKLIIVFLCIIENTADFVNHVWYSLLLRYNFIFHTSMSKNIIISQLESNRTYVIFLRSNWFLERISWIGIAWSFTSEFSWHQFSHWRGRGHGHPKPTFFRRYLWQTTWFLGGQNFYEFHCFGGSWGILPPSKKKRCQLPMVA